MVIVHLSEPTNNRSTALIRNPVLHRVAIAYWPEHAAWEVRVARTEANRGNRKN